MNGRLAERGFSRFVGANSSTPLTASLQQRLTFISHSQTLTHTSHVLTFSRSHFLTPLTLSRSHCLTVSRSHTSHDLTFSHLLRSYALTLSHAHSSHVLTFSRSHVLTLLRTDTLTVNLYFRHLITLTCVISSSSLYYSSYHFLAEYCWLRKRVHLLPKRLHPQG